MKRFSENVQQTCRKTPIPKCDLNKVAKHGCSPVNFAEYFQNIVSLEHTQGATFEGCFLRINYQTISEKITIFCCVSH